MSVRKPMNQRQLENIIRSLQFANSRLQEDVENEKKNKEKNKRDITKLKKDKTNIENTMSDLQAIIADLVEDVSILKGE